MTKFIDLTGQKFNRLTVISRAENGKNGQARWNCVCECNKKCIIIGKSLRSGHTKSCGCFHTEIRKARAENLAGQKFNRLTVVSRTKNHNNRTSWNCVCECGNKSVVSSDCLKSGDTKSCGCIKSPPTLERLDKYIDKSSGRWIWVGYKNKHGYGITFYKRKNYLAHRLIYELFIGKIPEEMCVCHKNDIKLDVTPSNLFLGTLQENSQDRDNKRRQARGEMSGVSKLKESDVLEIRQSDLSNKQLAELYKVHKSTIWTIKTRKYWTHI